MLSFQKLKQQKPLLGVVLVIIAAALLGGFYFLNSQSNPEVPTETGFSEEQFETISAEEIGLEVTVRGDGRAVMFEITKPEGIEHVEYQITYLKDLDGEEVSEGIFGVMNIALDGITKTDFREFGTCSSGRCRYDEGVRDVKIILKITKDDGKVYSAEQPVDLDS